MSKNKNRMIAAAVAGLVIKKIANRSTKEPNESVAYDNPAGLNPGMMFALGGGPLPVPSTTAPPAPTPTPVPTPAPKTTPTAYQEENSAYDPNTLPSTGMLNNAYITTQKENADYWVNKPHTD